MKKGKLTFKTPLVVEGRYEKLIVRPLGVVA